MYEQLFIQGLKIIPLQDGSVVEIFIPSIKREYEFIDAVPCDCNGRNADFSNVKRFEISKLSSNNNRLQLKSSNERNLYYRIVPVIMDNGNLVRIQCDDPENKNLVCIHMVLSSVSWHFKPYALVRKSFKKVDQFASLELTSSKKVEAGDLFYRIPGDPNQYPIPGFTDKLTIVFDRKVNSKALEIVNIEIGVSSISKTKYKINKI